MKVKRNLSIEKSVLKKGEDKAKSLGMTFSGYVTYLILKDIGEIAATIEPIKKIKNEKVSNAIDSILGD